MILVAFCGASYGCAHPQPRPVPVTEPPPRSIAVSEGPVVLRSTAWVELHTWLGAAAEDDRELPDAFAPARATYRSGHDFAKVTRALARCEDERCALAAVADEPYGNAYRLALPAFHDAMWRTRSESAWAAIEATHAAFGPEAIALFDRFASELEMKWPRDPVAVAMVAEEREVGEHELLAPAVASSGGCFARPRNETAHRRDARTLDCLLVRAALEAPALSATEARLLEVLGPADGRRAWTVLVIHAAATMMNAWGHHASVDRATAARAEPKVLAWLAEEWKGRSMPVRGEEPPRLAMFIDRYIAAWKEAH